MADALAITSKLAENERIYVQNVQLPLVIGKDKVEKDIWNTDKASVLTKLETIDQLIHACGKPHPEGGRGEDAQRHPDGHGRQIDPPADRHDCWRVKDQASGSKPPTWRESWSRFVRLKRSCVRKPATMISRSRRAWCTSSSRSRRRA
eukprot:733949-Pleurochrysis_carterae.AAC.2